MGNEKIIKKLYEKVVSLDEKLCEIDQKLSILYNRFIKSSSNQESKIAIDYIVNQTDIISFVINTKYFGINMLCRQFNKPRLETMNILDCLLEYEVIEKYGSQYHVKKERAQEIMDINTRHNDDTTSDSNGDNDSDSTNDSVSEEKTNKKPIIKKKTIEEKCDKISNKFMSKIKHE